MSSQCDDPQRNRADTNVVFDDAKYKFHDSWTCHTQNCTFRQRIIQCNTQKSKCMANWSCQQCIYGGSDLQCHICGENCKNDKCFQSSCFSYICSDSLRAYQCYYESSNCYDSHKDDDNSPTLESITANCKQCALNDQDVDACYECLNACQDHACWNNCSINSNFNLHPITFGNIDSIYSNLSLSTNSTQINGGTSPILLTPNAIYGIMAMVGLICLIFGFWCGKNCNAHSLSKACCKWCLFWCDDDNYPYGEDEFDEESAWNWKNNNESTVSRQGGINVKRRRGSKSVDVSNEDSTDISQDTQSLQNNGNGAKLSLNNHNIRRNNYGGTTTENRNYKNLRIRFPMTPLSSRELPEQQNVEQSPDVRVAHFSTPDVRGMHFYVFLFYFV